MAPGAAAVCNIRRSLRLFSLEYRGTSATVEPSLSASSSIVSTHSTRSTLRGLSYAAAEIAGTLSPSSWILFARVIPEAARIIGRARLTILLKFRRLKRNLGIS